MFVEIYASSDTAFLHPLNDFNANYCADNNAALTYLAQHVYPHSTIVVYVYPDQSTQMHTRHANCTI